MLITKTEKEWRSIKSNKQIQAIWDESGLGRQWVIGSTMELLTNSNTITIDDWESYYFSLGDERDKVLLNHQNSELITNYALVYEDKQKLYNIKHCIKIINYDYGRSLKAMKDIAKLFKNILLKHNIRKPLLFCFETVYLHTIIETWDGKKRELGVVKSLMKKYPQYDYKMTNNKIDSYYSVDLEIYSNNKLICGIQIKPPTYINSLPNDGLLQARLKNFKKHLGYKKKYGKKVYFIIANKDGSKYSERFIQEDVIDKDSGKTIINDRWRILKNQVI